MLDKKDLQAIKGIVDDGLDDLAIIVKKEFDQATNERKAIKRDVEEIKMKFAYCAWQIDVEEIKKRVIAVEKKVGIKY